MLSPLLDQTKEEKNKCSTLSRILLFLCMVVIGIVASKKVYFQSAEVGVGGFLSWPDLLLTYVEVGTLPRLMYTGAAYAGPDPPGVSLSRCGDNPPECSDVCLYRVKTGSKGGEPLFCHRYQKWIKKSFCWDTRKMRCWDEKGGNLIWDMRKDWVLISHHTPLSKEGGDSPRSPRLPQNIPWMHMRSVGKKIDFFMFGIAYLERVRRVSKICEEFEELKDVMGITREMSEIPLSHGVVLAGHSEGAGWAVCAEKYMSDEKLPHDRRILASGAMLDDRDGIELADNALFLMKAVKTPGLPPSGGKVVADVFTISNAKYDGLTFPQFGYTCHIPLSDEEDDEAVECVQPQPLIDLHMSVMLSRSNWRISGSKSTEDLHHFKSYTACFKACFGDKIDFIDFSPNIPQLYVKSKDIGSSSRIPSSSSYSNFGSRRERQGSRSPFDMSALSRSSALSYTPPERPRSTSPYMDSPTTPSQRERGIEYHNEFERGGRADTSTNWRRPSS